MIVHTASFFAPAKGLRVSVANSDPKGITCVPGPATAAPGWWLVNELKSGRMSEAEYTRIYMEKLNIEWFFESLLGFMNTDTQHGYDEITFCCWEKRGEFCHRHLLAEVIREHGHKYGIQLGDNE